MKKVLMLALVSLGLAHTTKAQTGIETKTVGTSAVLEFATGLITNLLSKTNYPQVAWKYVSFFLLFSILSWSPSNKKEVSQTKYLIEKSIYYTTIYDGIKSLEYAQKALKMAKKTGHVESLVESYCAVAESTASLGLYEEALKYIEEGEKLCPTDNQVLKAKILFLKGRCFAYLGFTDKALESYHLAIKILTSTKNKQPKNTELLLSIYQHLLVSYYDKGNVDSISKYQEKSHEQISKLKHADLNANLFSTHYFNKSQDYLDLNQGDTAFAVLNEFYKMKKDVKASKFHVEHIVFGFYYLYKKDYEKALHYNLKAIGDIEKYKITQVELVEVYKAVSELYRILGNPQKEREYLEKYVEKKGEVSSRQMKNMEHAMNVILNDKLDQESESYIRTIVGISGGAIVIISVLFLLYRRLQRKESDILNQLRESDETVGMLQLQVGNCFEELIQLAKKNDPQFWIRFQEVHPKFLKKMLALNPKLGVAELTMMAYHYLGFTTKDISNYTFKSLRTIEGIRHRIRKKLAIGTDENFIIWIRTNLDEA